MNELILLTGAGGFVGQSLTRCAERLDDVKLLALARASAVAQIEAAVSDHSGSRISILNLAWPSVPSSSAEQGQTTNAACAWTEYLEWLDGICNAADRCQLRFFQVGSGVERYASCDSQDLSGAYLDYAHQKNEAWTRIRNVLPTRSWRLRLHFLFGVGEAPQRLIPAAIVAAHRGKPLAVGSLERQRAWADIDDIAAGLLEAVRQDQPEDWDICGHHLISIGDMLEMVAESVGSPVELEPSRAEPADAGLTAVEPQAVAPFLHSELGSSKYLQQRLSRYARILQS